MREAYPTPPPETQPHPLERCASPESVHSYAASQDEQDEPSSLPDTPPPVPEKDDVQAVRAQYEPVSAAELKSLYDEIWLSLPDDADTSLPASSTVSTASIPGSAVRSPTPIAAPPPPSPVTSTSGCASCSACVARARSRSSVSSVASASLAALGRSPRRPRRPTLSSPCFAIVDPPVAQPTPRVSRSSTKRRRAPEAAMRRVTPTKPSAGRRPHPGGPRPIA